LTRGRVLSLAGAVGWMDQWLPGWGAVCRVRGEVVECDGCGGEDAEERSEDGWDVELHCDRDVGCVVADSIVDMVNLVGCRLIE
jgi:hypothetical protein